MIKPHPCKIFVSIVALSGKVYNWLLSHDVLLRTCCAWQPTDKALVKATPKEAWVSSKAADSLCYSYDSHGIPYPGILHNTLCYTLFCSFNFFYAFTQCSVSSLSVHLSVCLCLHPETLLTQYLDEYMTDLHQTCINCAMQDRNEGFKFGVKRWNKVQGHRHGGITYAVMSAMGGGILHVELELLL